VRRPALLLQLSFLVATHPLRLGGRGGGVRSRGLPPPTLAPPSDYFVRCFFFFQTPPPTRFFSPGVENLSSHSSPLPFCVACLQYLGPTKGCSPLFRGREIISRALILTRGLPSLIFRWLLPLPISFCVSNPPLFFPLGGAPCLPQEDC